MSDSISFEIEDTVLKMIADHNGEWGWYQLDRALSCQGMFGISIPSLVAALDRDGFLSIEGDPASVSSRFTITNAGLARLGRAGP
jgi:hypothetical protein